MSNESLPKCPQCGVSLPDNAPAGLCPNCLMALNLKTETVFTDDTPAAQPPLPPEQIAPHFPQLEILGCLGRGGMGVVYKARQKTLNRLVALKLLAPERVRDAKFAERFTREAQALAALNHPNIVTIYDFGQAGGFYYLLMEFVDGLNLRQLLRARKFTPEEALAIVPPLCDALQFAHDRGIIHRDIKPENLLLDKVGRVKVADFGIAKMLGTVNGGGNAGESAAPENATQTAVGTPNYSAPEQKTDPQRVDSRADIYSLGVVFYEMLTGELPGKRIEPPSKKVQIDVRLDEVVLRALERKPELRYQQVSEVKTMVETIVATPGGAGGPPTKPPIHEPALLKVSSCYYTTPEYAQSFAGRFIYVYSGKGELRLDEENLIFSSEWFSTVIPLRMIQNLRIGSFSRLAKPLGLDYLFVEYKANDQIQRIILTPALSPFTPTWATNERVAEWLMAIRQAVAKAGGIAAGSVSNKSANESPGVAPGRAERELKRGGIVLVGRRNGQRVIVWRGVANNFFAISGCVLITLLLLRFFMPIGTEQMIAFMSLAVLVTAGGVIMGFRVPIEQLTPLDGSLSGSGGRPAGYEQRRRKLAWKLLMASWACLAAVLVIKGVQWWSKYEPAGVWIPSPINGSISGEYGEAWLHVTEVSQRGQVVLMAFMCETPYPDRGLFVQYSGPAFGFPTDIASAETNLDSLKSPTFMSGPGGGRTLVGSDLLKGKSVYQIGFVLPDAATAAKVVEQVKAVHLGKPRGLDQNNCVLELFVLHRRVGKKANGEPVTEHLDAMLVWQPKRDSTPNPKLAAAQNFSFGPVMERLLPDSKDPSTLSSGDSEPSTNSQVMVNFDSGELFIGAKEKWAVQKRGAIGTRSTLYNSNIALGITPELNGVVGLDTAIFPAVNRNWDEITVNSIVEHFYNAQIMSIDRYPAAYNTPLASIWIFRTSNGSMGIIQILGFTNNPRGVKIRYKLVENEPNSTALSSGSTITSVPIPLSAPSVGVDYTVAASNSAPLIHQRQFKNTNSTATNNAATFGPVVERTIYDYKSGKDWLLNLKTGETFSLPPGVDWDRNASAVWEWVHQHGIHVMGHTPVNQHWHTGDPVPVIQTLDHGYGLPMASQRAIYGFEMKAAIIQEKDVVFETITPLQVSNTLQQQISPPKGISIRYVMAVNSIVGPWLSQFASMAWHDAAWHGLDDYLYAFQTDDGQSGVLQITGFTEKPRGVKIRFKLVQNSNQQKP